MNSELERFEERVAREIKRAEDRRRAGKPSFPDDDEQDQKRRWRDKRDQQQQQQRKSIPPPPKPKGHAAAGRTFFKDGLQMFVDKQGVTLSVSKETSRYSFRDDGNRFNIMRSGKFVGYIISPSPTDERFYYWAANVTTDRVKLINSDLEGRESMIISAFRSMLCWRLLKHTTAGNLPLAPKQLATVAALKPILDPKAKDLRGVLLSVQAVNSIDWSQKKTDPEAVAA